MSSCGTARLSAVRFRLWWQPHGRARSAPWTLERRSVVKPSHLQRRSSRIISSGRLTVVLLGIAGLCGPAAAADNGPVPIVVSPSTVERPLPETTPGGTVVLRGPPPTCPTAAQPEGNDQPVAVLPALGGWNRNYDTSGFDRSGYDTTGLDTNTTRTTIPAALIGDLTGAG